eukprot:CAMPEP_0184083202 /NCGR_PEP_ID=MMETSP0974-20121125/3588_1 /TAXON_ID=483370 /ORGANISM="non described non described, Strain CCMP2097" /LENGTH=192 /DNA_ID=CAMNT_0026385877 /DNA_START=57 /DNA_END=635 /DNA_ORIENTATION=+
MRLPPAQCPSVAEHKLVRWLCAAAVDARVVRLGPESQPNGPVGAGVERGFDLDEAFLGVARHDRDLDSVRVGRGLERDVVAPLARLGHPARVRLVVLVHKAAIGVRGGAELLDDGGADDGVEFLVAEEALGQRAKLAIAVRVDGVLHEAIVHQALDQPRALWRGLLVERAIVVVAFRLFEAGVVVALAPASE